MRAARIRIGKRHSRAAADGYIDEFPPLVAQPPSNWNLDASVFRTFPLGNSRLEFRVESQNVFNHAQWGNPVTGFTNPNFMRIRSLARPPRTVQVGVRFAF